MDLAPHLTILRFLDMIDFVLNIRSELRLIDFCKPDLEMLTSDTR